VRRVRRLTGHREATKLDLRIGPDADAPAGGFAGRVKGEGHATGSHEQGAVDTPAAFEHISHAIQCVAADDCAEVDGLTELHAMELTAIEAELAFAVGGHDLRPGVVIRI